MKKRSRAGGEPTKGPASKGARAEATQCVESRGPFQFVPRHTGGGGRSARSRIKYSGTLERYAGDGVMVIFNDPVPVENPALQAVLMALEMREAIGALIETWRRLGHDIGFGIGIAHGFATLGTIGFEGRFDYAAIGTVSNVASRLCDEAKPGQIIISPRVLMKVENAVSVEPVGEFELKGIRRPLAAYNVVGAAQGSN